MADDTPSGEKAARKRAKPMMVPLAGGADAAFATPVVTSPSPLATAMSDPVSPITPEPHVAEPATIEPAPAEPVATAPVLDEEPVIDAAAAFTADALNEGIEDMATAFQPTAPTAAATETAEKAKVLFGDMNLRAKAAMEKSVKMGEELTELTKGNVEAVMQSGRVAAKGAEALAQDAAETMKKHFESATATMKSFTAVKSPTELFQLQSDVAKTYFDTAVADMSKFTEQMIKLAGDVAQPLSSRYAVAMEKVKATSL